ncbi:hypothetical protein BDW68DRAFT_11073 [Aspergillus falconensis]
MTMAVRLRPISRVWEFTLVSRTWQMTAAAFAARFALWGLVRGCCRLSFTGLVMLCDLGLLLSAFFLPLHFLLPLSSIHHCHSFYFLDSSEHSPFSRSAKQPFTFFIRLFLTPH